jgi:integrase/YHS domain-containing protein
VRLLPPASTQSSITNESSRALGEMRILLTQMRRTVVFPMF